MDGNIQFITITFTIEKRLFGVILTILGFTGLILSTYNLVQGSTVIKHGVVSVTNYCIMGIGIIFFFAGIGLIRNTRDLTNLKSVQNPSKRSPINEHGKLIILEESRQVLKEKIKEYYPEILDADLIFMRDCNDESAFHKACSLQN